MYQSSIFDILGLLMLGFVAGICAVTTLYLLMGIFVGVGIHKIQMLSRKEKMDNDIKKVATYSNPIMTSTTREQFNS